MLIFVSEANAYVEILVDGDFQPIDDAVMGGQSSAVTTQVRNGKVLQGIPDVLQECGEQCSFMCSYHERNRIANRLVMLFVHGN